MLAVSVVLPCYRSAPVAAQSVQDLQRCFTQWLPRESWEIIVVDDGGGDFPDNAWAADSNVTLIRLPANRGKGAAVRAGVLAARGRVRLFTDVDLPYGTDLIRVMAMYVLERGCHLVIGDRMLPSSVYHADMPWQRRLVSRASARFIGGFVTGGFFDTQCGIKAVRGDIADLVFPMMTLQRFAFDVELIYIALLHRLEIRRVPVQLSRNDTTSVRALRDSVRGLIDVMSIKLNQMRGAYANAALLRYSEEEYRIVSSSVPAGQADSART